MFLNKAKEQLGPDKANASSFPHSSSSSTSSPHYPTAVLAIPGSVDTSTGLRLVPKQEGGNPGGGGGPPMSAIGGHLHQSHSGQNVTVVPVPSTGIMTAGQWGTVQIFFSTLKSQHPPPPLPSSAHSIFPYVFFCIVLLYKFV